MSVLLTAFFATLISSAQTQGTKYAPPESPQPICFEARPLEKSKADRSYKHFRRLFQKNKTPRAEILARLIYAETIASGAKCQDRHIDISHHIASVLDQRIKKDGNIEDVIFKDSQFASSLHFYKESAVAQFLCPEKSKLWEKTVQWAQQIDQGKFSNTLPENTFNYYLYQHSPRFTPPAWTKSLKAIDVPPGNLNDCIRFFENRNFR